MPGWSKISTWRLKVTDLPPENCASVKEVLQGFARPGFFVPTLR
jgi:hypothetical protein